MDALLVGSRALRHWYQDFRFPRDWDLFVKSEQYKLWLAMSKGLIAEIRESRPNKFVHILKCGVKLEIEVADPDDSVDKFIGMNFNTPRIQLFGFDTGIASAGTLMALKRSHLYWPHNWTKHIKDYHFLKDKGVDINLYEQEALELRIKEKKEGNPDKTIFSLDVPNDDFFDASEASLGRSFEHDDIHAATCYYDEPLYRKAKRDLSKAMIDRDLFEQMSYEDQCMMVREEAFVIALERRIIPYLLEPLSPDPVDTGEPIISRQVIDSAFNYAVMRICTNLTRGWFRDFAIENYPAICEHNCNFVGKFIGALKAGKVRKRAVPSSEASTAQG